MEQVLLVRQERNKDMAKVIIEVGSTVTKVDLYDGEKVKRIKEKTIFFKKIIAKIKKLVKMTLKN